MATTFFREDVHRRFHLKEEYDTEVKIKALQPQPYITWLQTPAETEEVKDGLLTCVQNVVLIRDPDNPDVFYPVRGT